LFIAPHPLSRRFDFKYPLQYKQYAAERAAKQAQSPGYWDTQSNHAFWNSAKVQLLLFCVKICNFYARSDFSSQTRWPELADAALTWLQVPTSSVAAERVFAQARVVDTDQRQSLTWENFCTEVFLRSNKWVLERVLEDYLL
jgi:hypothetical protein